MYNFLANGTRTPRRKEGRVLNRILRWKERSIEYDCDPRQVERLIAECGRGGLKVTGVATRGVKATFKELEEDSSSHPNHLNTAFRGAAARVKYLVPDGIELQYACKEVSRWMANTSLHAWQALKRICRYFVRAPRLVYEFWEQTVDRVDIHADTDWAGCPKTRKSTSGGCVMLGGHAIKHWSSTQASISLSFEEAEFAGVIIGGLDGA